MANYAYMRALANLESKVNNINISGSGSESKPDFSEVHDRINALEEKLAAVNQSSSQPDFSEVHDRINALEEKIAAANQQSPPDFSEVHDRINVLEEKLNASVDQPDLSDLYSQIATIELKISTINLTNIYDRLSALESREDFSNRISALESNDASLASRINTLETVALVQTQQQSSE